MYTPYGKGYLTSTMLKCLYYVAQYALEHKFPKIEKIQSCDAPRNTWICPNAQLSKPCPSILFESIQSACKTDTMARLDPVHAVKTWNNLDRKLCIFASNSRGHNIGGHVLTVLYNLDELKLRSCVLTTCRHKAWD